MYTDEDPTIPKETKAESSHFIHGESYEGTREQPCTVILKDEESASIASWLTKNLGRTLETQEFTEYKNWRAQTRPEWNRLCFRVNDESTIVRGGQAAVAKVEVLEPPQLSEKDLALRLVVHPMQQDDAVFSGENRLSYMDRSVAYKQAVEVIAKVSGASRFEENLYPALLKSYAVFELYTYARVNTGRQSLRDQTQIATVLGEISDWGTPLTSLLKKRIGELGEISLPDNPVLSDEQVIRLIVPVIQTLANLHEIHNVMHQDLYSPNLIMVGDSLKIADFGSSRFITPGEDVTYPAERIQSPLPEDSHYPNKRIRGFFTDYYRIGQVIYEMKTGSRDVYQNVGTGVFAADVEQLSEPLKQVVKGLCHINYQERMSFRRALELLTAEKTKSRSRPETQRSSHKKKTLEVKSDRRNDSSSGKTNAETSHQRARLASCEEEVARVQMISPREILPQDRLPIEQLWSTPQREVPKDLRSLLAVYRERFLGFLATPFNERMQSLAGADTRVLRSFSGASRWYTALGSLILMVAVVSSVSMWFALRRTLLGQYNGEGVLQQQSWFQFLATVFLAIVWAFFILLVDRVSVLTIDNKHGKSRVAHGGIRLVIAIVIGAIVSVPLTIQIFSSDVDREVQASINRDINNHLSASSSSESATKAAAYASQLDKTIAEALDPEIIEIPDPDEITKVKKEIEALKKQIQTKEADAEKSTRANNCELTQGLPIGPECEGVPLSGNAGVGSKSGDHLEDALQAGRDRDALIRKRDESSAKLRELEPQYAPLQRQEKVREQKKRLTHLCGNDQATTADLTRTLSLMSQTPDAESEMHALQLCGYSGALLEFYVAKQEANRAASTAHILNDRGLTRQIAALATISKESLAPWLIALMLMIFEILPTAFTVLEGLRKGAYHEVIEAGEALEKQERTKELELVARSLRQEFARIEEVRSSYYSQEKGKISK